VRRFDVAIVGAGPAGSSAAIFLARRGYSVALIDKAVFPRDKLCGDFLNPAGWKLFERLGIRDALLAAAHEKIESFHVSTPAAEAVIPFPEQNGARLFGLGVTRRVFDHLLVQRAVGAGAALLEGCRLKAVERYDGGWILQAEAAADNDRLHARLLVAADGRNSWTARRLGVSGRDAAAGKFVGLQINLTAYRGARGEIQIHLFPGGYAGLMGLPGGAANLAFAIGRDLVQKNSIDYLLESHLKQNPHLKDALAGCAIAGEVRSAYPLEFVPRRAVGDGFLLAGDAVRVTEPVTGEGVFFALKTGELAAETVDHAFARGDLTADGLAPYVVACRRALARREGVNRLIRALVYRPRLATPLVRLSAGGHFPINLLVNQVCQVAP
jgi:geranylgeranyl reductase family protein